MADARLLKTSTNNAFSTTLNGSINDSDTSITLTTASGLQAPGIICIDRQNNSSVDTPSVREYISFTGISSQTLTGCTRGLGGSNAQAHSSGALTEELFSVTHWGDLVEFLGVSFNTDGTIKTSTALTTPKITTSINDSGGNEVIKMPATASAVNEVTLTNSATGDAVGISATGGDTNIDLSLTGKGTGGVKLKKKQRTGTTTSSATPTINTDNVDFYSLTAQAEAITSFTTNLSGTPSEGQTLWIVITGTAARAITWGASFESSTVTLPTTTVTTARLDVGFVWNTVTSKWRCIATG
jgi:hypothetical protein